MKIAILGATGRTGMFVVKQALSKGYQVKVLVRDPEKLGEFKDKVEVVEGNSLNYTDVENLIKNTDMVVSVLGASNVSPEFMQRDSIRNVVIAMKKLGLKRLISLTGGGVRIEGDKPKFIDNLIVSLMQVVAKKVLEDGKAHAEIIRNSDLDWTIVRAPRLTLEKGKGKYQIGMVGSSAMKTKISREDVAKFIVDILENSEFFGKLPMVSS